MLSKTERPRNCASRVRPRGALCRRMPKAVALLAYVAQSLRTYASACHTEQHDHCVKHLKFSTALGLSANAHMHD